MYRKLTVRGAAVAVIELAVAVLPGVLMSAARLPGLVRVNSGGMRLARYELQLTAQSLRPTLQRYAGAHGLSVRRSAWQLTYCADPVAPKFVTARWIVRVDDVRSRCWTARSRSTATLTQPGASMVGAARYGLFSGLVAPGRIKRPTEEEQSAPRRKSALPLPTLQSYLHQARTHWRTTRRY